MKKIVAFLAFAAACLNVHAQGQFAYKMREVQYDQYGTSMTVRVNPFPAPGIRCFRILDGDLSQTTGPSCATLGNGITFDPSTYTISVNPVQGAQGATGATGAQGTQGVPGQAGTNGTNGNDGASAYQVAVNNGFTGTQPQWLVSLQGATGPAGTTTWAGLSGKPTTLAGFGITDGVTNSSLTATLGGYALVNSLSNYATSSALASGLAAKLNAPSGTATQYVNGTGSLTSRSFANTTRALNTAFQLSTTRDAHVTYTVDISVTAAVVAGASGRCYLEYADDSAFTTNVVTVNASPLGISGVLNVASLGSSNVTGWVPAGKYARIRTAVLSGAPVFTFQGSQEVLQ